MKTTGCGTKKSYFDSVWPLPCPKMGCTHKLSIDQRFLCESCRTVVPPEIRRPWRNRQPKVCFNLYSQYLDNLISNLTVVYDVEANLNGSASITFDRGMYK